LRSAVYTAALFGRLTGDKRQGADGYIEKRCAVSADIKIKLQAELDELESELRVHLPKEIKRALEFGDLRENSEYRAALDRQNVVKARIVELRQRISEIGSIDLSKISRNKAGYGSTLLLYDGEKDEEVTYQLVTPEESDPEGGLISTTSPVGKSLMGKEEGDEVVVRTPAGARNFEIRRLVTIHDQVEDKS
jgi:transcription elongation factor GreA